MSSSNRRPAPAPVRTPARRGMKLVSNEDFATLTSLIESYGGELIVSKVAKVCNRLADKETDTGKADSLKAFAEDVSEFVSGT